MCGYVGENLRFLDRRAPFRYKVASQEALKMARTGTERTRGGARDDEELDVHHGVRKLDGARGVRPG